MRRLVAALVLATVAISVVGCGGGEDPGAVMVVPAATSTAGAGTQEKTPLEDTLSPTQTISPDQEAYPEPWTAPVSRTPKAIQKRLDDHQPMLIVFIDSKQRITKDQKNEISAVMEDYGDLVDVLYYDVASVVPGSHEPTDTEAAKAASLATEMRVSFLPYLLFVDQFGRITWRFNGYVDRKLIEREVLRATK
jgi:hypothetical protein